MMMQPTSAATRHAAVIVVTLLALAGCRQQMAVQPSVRPLRPTPFFKDGTSALTPVAGTVARGQLRDDEHLHEGRLDRRKVLAQAAGAVAASNPLATPFTGGPALTASMFVESATPHVAEFPHPITRDILERGRVQYGIFCAVCHDAVGTGQGMIVRRGYTRPPSFHIPRLRQARVGHFFEVITKGHGAMPDYASQINVDDRWAIIAYVRALQRSQSAALADVPADARPQLTAKEETR
ncbi:MAG: cytochrome c [Gemmataceae bacterium]|nr:cytochrome c [Gemmataceae bacterium]